MVRHWNWLLRETVDVLFLKGGWNQFGWVSEQSSLVESILLIAGRLELDDL